MITDRPRKIVERVIRELREVKIGMAKGGAERMAYDLETALELDQREAESEPIRR